MATEPTEGPEFEPLDGHSSDDALADSEIDFDDEAEDDQLPLDEAEAEEIGANLDDPERLSED
jgi:hypothetical protein